MMIPHYADATTTVYAGDCVLDGILAALPDASVDAVVTDPPYGLEFMGKEWDAPWAAHFTSISGGAPLPDRQLHVNPSCRTCGGYQRGTKNKCGCAVPDWRDTQAAAVARKNVGFQAWCELWTAECLRVLKPGGHLLAFGGTRTWHRLACAVEDAGFEVRDSIAWLYGSGFPKSLDVSKAIDKAAGAEREVVGPNRYASPGRRVGVSSVLSNNGPALMGNKGPDTAPATDGAREWQGWGTALKPAFEPIVVARKPLVGTVAASVLMHGTGALNIDACRIAHASEADLATSQAKNPGRTDTVTSRVYGAGRPQQSVNTAGRWPANVVLDESQAEELDEQSGEQRDGVAVRRNGTESGEGWGRIGHFEPGAPDAGHGGSGGASRFFYCPKAGAAERTRSGGTAHPTVKPLALMRWLVRLVTPPGGTVLEPFAGSGTTVEACILEGFRCIAVEREADYLPLIVQRINRRRDPVEAVKGSGVDGGLFDLLDGGAA